MRMHAIIEAIEPWTPEVPNKLIHDKHLTDIKSGAVLMIGFEFGFKNSEGWFSSSENDRARIRSFNIIFGENVVDTIDTWSKSIK